MQGTTSNFSFLRDCDARLFRLTTLAEQYAFSDPAAALIKLRQFGEFLAKDVAARHALLPNPSISFDDVLRTLRARSVLPREASDWLFHLKRVGNAAAHEDLGAASDALTALKVARATAIWFRRSYGGAEDFRAGPFVPPLPPTDASNELISEIEVLRAAVKASDDVAAKAQLASQRAEQESRDAAASAQQLAEERAFWEQYAAETDASAATIRAELLAMQAQAAAAPPQQLDLLAQVAVRESQTVEIDESTTRILIDQQLRATGWMVDSVKLRHSRGSAS